MDNASLEVEARRLTPCRRGAYAAPWRDPDVLQEQARTLRKEGPLNSIIPEATYWIRRSNRHVTLAAVAIAITCLAYAVTSPPDVRHRLSVATAYAGLIFLALSLLLGPWNVNPTPAQSPRLRSAP